MTSNVLGSDTLTASKDFTCSVKRESLSEDDIKFLCSERAPSITKSRANFWVSKIDL